MKPANNKIIVKVNHSQKSSVNIAGSDFLLAKEYNHNRRESMPVVCEVVEGTGTLSKGTFLLVHHNRFSENSPHHLEGNLYSLAYNTSIFARLDKQGNPIGLCNNIIVDRVYENNSEFIPQHLKKYDKHKNIVAGNGFGFKKGQVVFCFDLAAYEIIYVWNGEEKRVWKVVKSDVVGKINK